MALRLNSIGPVCQRFKLNLRLFMPFYDKISFYYLFQLKA